MLSCVVVTYFESRSCTRNLLGCSLPCVLLQTLARGQQACIYTIPEAPLGAIVITILYISGHMLICASMHCNLHATGTAVIHLSKIDRWRGLCITSVVQQNFTA